MNRGWKRFLPFLLGFAFSLQTESMASLSVEQPAGAACFCWFRPALLEGNRLRGIPMGVKESRGLKGRESTCWQMLHGGDRHADRRVRAKLSHISSFLSSGKRWMDGKLPTKTFASTISGGVCTDGSDDEFHYPEGSTKFIAECELPTDRGVFRMRAYRYKGAKVVIREGERVLEWTEMEPVVIYKQAKKFVDPVAVRVHDQCYTSEVLGSKRCDCKEQLDLALDYINQFGGALIYMPQEGRGIGLANKVAAYHLQDGGLDTVDANRQLAGFGDDERSYECIPYILEDMGIKSIQLMTNNPFKIRQLSELGVTIAGTKPHVVKPNVYNEKYLRAKVMSRDGSCLVGVLRCR
ncbi:hypothetical protein GUITHDRAFT_86681 [Guillardia theta CCMP2712]|uniref:GTP cyclohydrolase II n=1 Tax=Guillardia theta (strain CCMP2712) TaxID=905079 RepID=L1JE47_GUITC|nr:hypothetical protein GUITHDRAFT_86681 [Guillardia theta CCMP2712]EKX46409.1 hypothetical protein GUITHDRAFT_86681 [Guillardia theta CCMP2712]|eukprot:XP_005833389.1 hypothetical protein GUITHDRAFT_86681 [Guillardia theta CCMP2712]